MKQVFFISLVCLLTFNTAFAQNRFGLKLGLNFAELHAFNNPLGTDHRLAFTMGGIAEFDLAEKFGLGVGLLFVGKGFTTHQIYRPLYLQVPVRMYYRNKYFTLGVGPYVGVGVAGKIKTPTLSGNLTQGLQLDYDWEDIRYGYGQDDHFTPFDVGMGAEFSLRLTRLLRLFISYDLGLTQVLPSEEQFNSNATVSNTVFCIGLTRLWSAGKK